MRAPLPLSAPELAEYFLQHVDLQEALTGYLGVSQGGVYKVKIPLRVFKKAYVTMTQPCIVNLIIPAGALVYAQLSAWDSCRWVWPARKMRASRALVHSVVRLQSPHQPEACAWSRFDPCFEYRPGTEVRPTEPFERVDRACAYGIHFFLQLADAKAFVM